MKFLYVANERQAAEQAGLALRSVAPDVAVSWAASLGQARRWIDENRNVTALIIEVESDSRSFEALVTHARGIGVKVPVIGIPLIEISDVLISLRAVADEVVPRDAAFLDELPQAVSRALFPRHAQVREISVPPYDQRLQQQLRDAEAAAARADERARDALDQSRAREERLHSVIERERAARVELERRLADAESARQKVEAAHREAESRRVREAAALAEDLRRRDQELVNATAVRQALEEELTNAASELEQVRQRESALTENLSDETRTLAQELAEAKRIVRLADQLHATTKSDAETRVRNIQEQTDARLADATSVTTALQHELADTVARHAENDRAHRKAIEALEAARQDLDTRLAAAAEARRQLEKQHASAMAATRAALLTAEQRASKQQSDAAAAAQSLGSKLAESVANADRLRAQLSEAQSALTSAGQQATADRQAAAEQLARQQATFDAALADEVARRDALASDLADRDLAHKKAIQALEAARHDLEARLAAAGDTRRQLEDQHASASAAARAALESAEQRANQQQTAAAAAAQVLDAKLAESVANADRLRAQLSETQLALTNAEQQASADRQEAAEQLARQQETFDAALAREVARRRAWTSELAERDLTHQKAVKGLEAARQDLEARLASAEETRRQLDEQHATSIEVVRGALEAVERRASKQQEEAAAATHVLKAELAESLADAERLRVELSETAAALTEAKQRAASDRQLAADDANRRQAEFETSIGKEVADRKALQLHLVELQQQLDARATQAATDRQAAAQQAAERRAEFETALALEIASRQAIETQLIEEQGARQKAEAQSAIDLAAARDELASYRENSESRFAKQQQDADTRLTEQAKLADARLAEAMTNAAKTLEASLQQASAHHQAAADRFAARQAALEASLDQEVANTQAVVKQLAEAEAKAARLQSELVDEQQARHSAAAQFAVDLAVARDEFAGYREQSDSRFAKQQQDADARLTEQTKVADARLEEAMANAAATLRDSLQHEKAEREAAADRFAGLQAALEVDLALARQSLAASQSQIQQLEAANTDGRAKLSALQQAFEQAKAAAQQSLEALSREHASERTRMQAMVAERDRQLAEQATRHQGANEAAARAKADVEHRLQTALQAGQRDSQAIKQLEQRLAAASKDLEALNRQREVLKTEAERVPVLQKRIDETHAEYRRRFEHSPIGMWRSRPDGAIVQANQALVSLLRYRTVDELLKVNFSTAVFESADELQWLVDRCLASRTTETVETTWRRKDGVGLVVRLMAVATSPEAVDFVAMDITTLRALEEKLRNSQRMESVARYASEVAATCTRLLGQVNQEGQHWLTRIESDSARHQGALLLDDVTRAAGFLDQLMLYGKEQKKAPERVEVKQVLRDLEQVLGRVAGGHVELVMPKTSSPYNLDVEMERFERILVNVAAYGRERMPFGGRLVINVSPVVVDRTFVDKYPNVRPGAHVLLTFTEQKGATTPDWSTTVRDQASGGNGSAPSPHKPGVDLGALQALVNECGGHLWLLAEPGGNMELRIHLPRRVLDDRVPANKSGRRWISKLAGVRNREAV